MDKQCITLTFKDLSSDIASNVSVGTQTNLVHHPAIEEPPQSQYWKGSVCFYIMWDQDIITDFYPYSIDFYVQLDRSTINHTEIQKLIDEFCENGGQTQGYHSGVTRVPHSSIKTNTPPSWLDEQTVFGVGEETTEFLVYNGVGPISLSRPVKHLIGHDTILAKAKKKYSDDYFGYSDFYRLVTRNGKTFTKLDKFDELMAAASISYEIGGRYMYGTESVTFHDHFNNQTTISSLQYNYVAYSDLYGIIGTGSFSFTTSTEWGPIPAYSGSQGG